MDLGTPGGQISTCKAIGFDEQISTFHEPDRAVLPSALHLDDKGGAQLEHNLPLRPLGTGEAWPPEAWVCQEWGSRRLPLALGMAWLESGKEDAWLIPRLATPRAPETSRRAISRGMREALQNWARSQDAGIALAIPSGLSLQYQSAVSTAPGARHPVRLLWRSVAAVIGELGPHSQEMDGLPQWQDGTRLLHVHLGLDGFEASSLEIRRYQGDEGPELQVPVRLSSSSLALSNPLLGIQRAARLLEGQNLGLWGGLFTSPCPLSDSSIHQALPPHALPWAEAFAHADDQWDAHLRRTLERAQSLNIRHVLLSGEFAQPDSWMALSGDTTHDTIPATLRRRGFSVRIAQRAAISRGSALFLSRRARGWATYLDKLPKVELLVLAGANPEWRSLFGDEYHDAGKPKRIALPEWGRIPPGQDTVTLPVIVENFGSVRESSLKFGEAPQEHLSVDLGVEIEVASGLPIVTATIPRLAHASVQLDWASAADLGKTKEQYLEALPKRYPPIEPRYDDNSWTRGINIADRPVLVHWNFQTLTIEAACRTYLEGQLSAVRRAELAKEMIKPLRIRILHTVAGQRAWFACTDLDGRNSSSQHCGPFQSALLNSYHAAESKFRETILRILGYTRFRSPACEALASRVAEEIGGAPLNDPLFMFVSECTYDVRLQGRALASLVRRLDYETDEARERGVTPKGEAVLKAIGSLLACNPDSTKLLTDAEREALADTVTWFMALSLKAGDGLNQKFRLSMKALVFMLRAREYQANFMDPTWPAFERAIKSCCIAGLIIHMKSAEQRRVPADRRLDGAKSALKHSLTATEQGAAGANEETLHTIDRLTLRDFRFPLPDVGKPDELYRLILDVILYIEGRGSGIIMVDDD
jgi:hypothetical protein